jgi:DNA-binding IclR family transcriptional regulator
LKATRNNQKSYSAPALEKGLDILELLARKKTPMTMPQISAALDRSKSEIYRMLTVLEDRGYLAREEGADQFRITNKLFDLGMSVSPVGTLVESAYPIMHELSENVRQSGHLVVASGDRIVIIARVESSAVFGFSVKVGRYASLFETTSGAVLLAWMPDTERLSLLQSHAKQAKDFDVTTFETGLESIRRRGWLQQESADVPGITDISVPIFAADNEQAIACLMVPFLETTRTKVPLKEAAGLVRAAAKRISALAATYHGF